MSSQPPYPDPYGGRDGPAPYGPGYGYGPTDPPGQPPPMPSSVRAAVGLMWAGAGLVVVGLLLLPSSVDTIREQAREQLGSSAAGAVDVDSAVRVGVAFALLVASLQLGLWIWMAVMNRRGRHWARVLSTVLGAVGIAFTVVGVLVQRVVSSDLTTADTLNTVLSVLTSVLAVAIIVLLWRPDSNRWYDAMRPRR